MTSPNPGSKAPGPKLPASPDGPLPDAHELKAMARVYFRQAYTLGDESAIDQVMAPDVLHHGLTREPMVGREHFKQWYRAFRSAFSDILCSVTHVCVEEDLLAARVLFSGKHTGDSLGPPPSGRQVTLSALVLCRFEGHQVVEAFNEFDHLGLMQQLGAVPLSWPVPAPPTTPPSFA